MTTTVDAPDRAGDLQLLGTMVGSGYRTPPSLVRRGDGQVLQLTPLLYRVLEAVDGHRTCAEIAAVVSKAVRRDVPEQLVHTLVDRHLRPLGLLELADGAEPTLKRSNPLLALRFKLAVTDPRTTRRLTDPFRMLFQPVVMLVVLGCFLSVTWWVFFRQGLAPAAYDAFQRPHLLLLVFVVTVLSGGFHEFGHAAAARYGGAEPGVMGAGIYLVWPAFYTDVTDSYRLGRPGRIRTDLGGLYFNALVVSLTFVAWYLTHWEALLLLVATQTLQMVQQLMPMMRFDGYHLLADLTGVPDLYQRIRPTLLGLLPHRWSAPENRVLKPWARLVITAWVLVTIPLMAVMLLGLVTTLPRVLATAWVSVQKDARGVPEAWGAGSPVDLSGQVVQVLAVALPVMAGLMILGRLGTRWSRQVVVWSRGSAAKRLAAIGLLTAVAVVLCWAWVPPSNYQPITRHDRGLLTSLLSGSQNDAERSAVAPRTGVPAADVVSAGSYAHQRLDQGSRPLTSTFEKGQKLPTRAHPQLALVLVPTRSGSGPAEGDESQPWVFPFDKPLPPAPGDNQAAAYNTTDGKTVYDVAFALVWATGDEVLNVNEAHAYASCSDCVTVAVAFQVVLIMDDAHVVVPQNLAVAANYQCYRCITAALASQLVLSVEREPDEQDLLALGEVWAQLSSFGATITQYSLSQVADQLDSFEDAIIAILGTAPPISSASSPTSAPSPVEPSSGATPTRAGSSGAPADAAPPEPAPTSQDAAPPAPADSNDTSIDQASTPAETGGTSPSEAPSPAAPDSPAPSP